MTNSSDEWVRCRWCGGLQRRRLLRKGHRLEAARRRRQFRRQGSRYCLFRLGWPPKKIVQLRGGGPGPPGWQRRRSCRESQAACDSTSDFSTNLTMYYCNTDLSSLCLSLRLHSQRRNAQTQSGKGGTFLDPIWLGLNPALLPATHMCGNARSTQGCKGLPRFSPQPPSRTEQDGMAFIGWSFPCLVP